MDLDTEIEIKFPNTVAAMEVFIPAFKAANAPQPPRDKPRERSEWHRLQGAADTAQAAVVKAYATEMLPTILGGVWQISTTWAEPDQTLYSDYHALLDHPIQFRRKAAKGPSNWENWVVFGRPYGPLERDRNLATHLSTNYDVGVWARSDLSAWYPGSTNLVIAARGLQALDATRFGFVVIGRAAA